MNKKILLIILICLTLLSARLPENPGISVIDGGTGAVGNSPLNSAIFNTDTNKLLFEFGGASYYDTPIFGKGEQLTNFFCGGLLNVGRNRFSLSMTSLNAFDLYSESNIGVSYAVSFLKIMHFGVTGNYLIFQSEGDYVLDAAAEVSGGLGNKIIMGVFSYSVRNIFYDRYDSVIREIEAVIRLKENRFGFQAVAFRIDDYNRRITTELIYGISLLPNIIIGATLVPKPFILKFGVVFNVKNIRSSAAFSLHNTLGLSKYLSMQYSFL